MVLIGIGAVIGLSAIQEPTYRASMKIVVGQGGGVFQPQFGASVGTFTQTMSSLIETDIVARRVIRNLRLRATPKTLLEDVHVSTRPESSVLEVSYDAKNRSEAVRTLAEIGVVFTTLVEQKLGREVVGETTGAALGITAEVFDPAHLEPDQVSPKPVRNAGLAGILGLGLGLLFGFLRESLDDRLRSRRDVEEWFGVSVVGVLPKGMVGQPPVGLANQRTPKDAQLVGVTELLRVGLQLPRKEDGGSTIFVTSAASGEGKSMVAANLAVALAMKGEDVICVDADAKQPALHRYLGVEDNSRVPASPGEGQLDVERSLREIALARTNGETRSREAVPLYSPGSTVSPEGLLGTSSSSLSGRRSRKSGRLRVLPAGFIRSDVFGTDFPGGLLDSVSDLRLKASYVIFDGPPILAMAEASPLLTASDKVIVVARVGKTRRGTAELAKDLFEGLGVRDFFVVVVDTKISGIPYH